jgi:hypothetical protein
LNQSYSPRSFTPTLQQQPTTAAAAAAAPPPHALAVSSSKPASTDTPLSAFASLASFNPSPTPHSRQPSNQLADADFGVFASAIPKPTLPKTFTLVEFPAIRIEFTVQRNSSSEVSCHCVFKSNELLEAIMLQVAAPKVSTD